MAPLWTWLEEVAFVELLSWIQEMTSVEVWWGLREMKFVESLDWVVEMVFVEL